MFPSDADQIRLNVLVDELWVLAALARAVRCSRIPTELAAVLTTAGWDVERSVEDECSGPTMQVGDPEVFAARVALVLRQAANLVEGISPADDLPSLKAEGIASGKRVMKLIDLLRDKFPDFSVSMARERLHMLDVGTGAAGVAAAFVGTRPGATAVGLDIRNEALKIAAAHLEQTGVADRVQLRLQDIEALTDRECFDVVWLPLTMLNAAAAAPAVKTIFEALRPGGWLITVTVPGGDSGRGQPHLSSVVARWRVAERGCCVWNPNDTIKIMSNHGFNTVYGGQVTTGDPPVLLSRRPFKSVTR